MPLTESEAIAASEKRYLSLKIPKLGFGFLGFHELK